MVSPTQVAQQNARSPKQTVAISGKLQRLPLSAIDVPQFRMRTSLEDIPELAESLESVGLLSPIIVAENDGRYRLVAGERRLTAARFLGAEAIDAIVRATQPGDDPYEAELVENAQRRQLSDEDEADAFIFLVRQRGREMQDIARLTGRSVAYVSTRIRVFEDPDLRGMVTSGQLPVASAQEFLRLPAKARHALAERAATERWSWGRVRAAVQAQLAAAEQKRAPKKDELPAQEHRAGAESNGADTADAQIPPALRVTHRRRKDLARRIQALTEELNNLRPFQFTPEDDAAMQELFLALHRIARAPRERKLVLPSLEEAQALARSRVRR